MKNIIQNLIIQKYKIREKNLRRILEDYLYHAERRLNVSLVGKARNTEEICLIVEKCEELLQLLPADPDINLDKNFNKSKEK